MAKEDNMRSKVFLLLLYPDEDVTHAKALEYIKANYDYAAICQDKDTYLEDTTINDVLHKEGELKKAHYHVGVRFKNDRSGTVSCLSRHAGQRKYIYLDHIHVLHADYPIILLDHCYI